LFFIWGITTVRYHVFPWDYLSPIDKEISNFVAGDASEQTGLGEKISNDLSFRPSRQLFDYQWDTDRAYSILDVPGLKSRRDLPRVFVDQGHLQLPGFRFIFGTFDFDNHLHGAILLDPGNQVINTWVVDEEAIQNALELQTQGDGIVRQHKAPSRRLPQGVEIFPDGSIIFNDGDRGNGIHRMDSCGRYIWTTPGIFHHSITLDRDSGTIWTFGAQDMMELDPASGEILRTISLNDIHMANPSLSLFTPRRNLRDGIWNYDPIHKNDIESLASATDADWSMFEPGDLLVSHRATNLLFVFDPDTLDISWWRAGQTRRQHDPDWQQDGSFTDRVRYSRIWKFVPRDNSAEIIYDGELDNMYSGERSKHQVLPNGNILLTSSHQGRILEVTPEGRSVFEFLNRYDQDQNLILSEAKWLPLDFFDIDFDDAARCQ
jgi:hypothetical protein